MSLSKAQIERLRTAPNFKETCPHCHEARLLWKFDWEDCRTKLWQPFHFHFCAALGGSQIAAATH